MIETKPCEQCGTAIERRGYRAPAKRWVVVRFCSRTCASAFNSGPTHYAWKGDAARTETKRERAQKAYPLGACEDCGAPAVDRHHRDADTGNNTPENVGLKCRRCHMAEDGRLDALRERMRRQGAARTKPPRECRICREVKKLASHGRCHACDMFWRRTGRERRAS